MFNIKTSHIDKSVNHYKSTSDEGMLEARWVQRTSDYAIVYLSSHTGCNLSCRFCHLTATRQTMMTDSLLGDYTAQLESVLRTRLASLKDGFDPKKLEKLHINFMARGEPLQNQALVYNSKELFKALESKAHEFLPNLPIHFLVSSILPKTLKTPLASILTHENSWLYYSLYSMNPNFRKRWIPKALPPEIALDLCKKYQEQTNKRITLHWALISGQNDSDKDIDDILKAVSSRAINAKFNLVRYNPHDNRHGVETSEDRLNEIFNKIKNALGDESSRIVPRVGLDVKASCGMFLPNK